MVQDRFMRLAGGFLVVALLAGCGGSSNLEVDTTPPSEEGTPVRLQEPVLTQVRVRDDFWSPRIETNRMRSLPHVLRQLEERGALRNFDIAAGRVPGTFSEPWWSDSDVYKWLEGASYSLRLHPDPELEARVEAIIERIAAAQQEDGYLNTFIQVAQPRYRWENLGFFHEMFCAGHLFEAAVAHYEATGRGSLLQVATRYADHLVSVFGPDRRLGLPGHEEIELALVRLYRTTGEGRYLDLAGFFVDQRGRRPSYFEEEYRRLPDTPIPFLGREISLRGLHDRFFRKDPDHFDTRYCQDHLPVREQQEAAGHAVRAMYLYSAMTDLVQETGDESLWQAVRRLHENVTARKMYVTGGVGPSGENEGFTEDYDLPNDTAYQETCASIGMMMWNHRLMNLTGRGRYADLLEQTLYNAFLGAVALSGETFCYVNPLYNQGKPTRREWFSVPCCPTNVVRFFPSLGRYIYSLSEEGLWVNLFIGSELQAEVSEGGVTLVQSTGYPWDGQVRIRIGSDRPRRFTLHLRIPGWASRFSLRLNGRPLQVEPAGGYLHLRRAWSDGDELELSLPLAVEFLEAHPRVKQDRGHVALRRGPLVYCLEEEDQPVEVDGIFLSLQAPFEAESRPDLLGGVMVLKGPGRVSSWEEGELYRSSGRGSWQEVEVQAIPYFAWGNRQPGTMKVWLPLAPGP